MSTATGAASRDKRRRTGSVIAPGAAACPMGGLSRAGKQVHDRPVGELRHEDQPREAQMARIKHIALVTDDPVKTAEFYKQHFGLTELYRRPSNTGERGVWLSDGYIYFAILKYGDAEAPKLGRGQTSDLRGIHHIGFQVDDQAATAKSLAEGNVAFVPKENGDPADPTPMFAVSEGAANLKYLGPDEVQFDVRQKGWDEAIELGMDRYELVPVKEAAE
jgi:catechol 2,3-dioxygenase-like lactoylglutathione lyase family enzyme